MYSYEDRIRAVTLYIQLGKRVAATIQQVGYPTKKSLESWPHFTLGFKSSIPGLGHACLEHRRTSRSTLRCSHCAHVKDASKPLLTTLACVERRCTTFVFNYWCQWLSHR